MKDGNDCYYYVNKHYVPQLYTDNKTIKTKSNAHPSYDKWEDIVLFGLTLQMQDYER